MKIIREKMKTLETRNRNLRSICVLEKVSDRTGEKQDLKWLSGNRRQKMA